MDVREKLAEILGDSFAKQYKTRCLLTVPHTVEDLIANGVTVQEWISVTEKLPEPKHEFDARNWYLVALSNGVVKELAYEFHEHSVFGYGWRETAHPVTHWMPLPLAPEDMK